MTGSVVGGAFARRRGELGSGVRPGAGLAVAAAAVSLLLGGCASKPVGPPPNVLLITLDTTRADHLPAYGYAVFALSIPLALTSIPLLGELGPLLRADPAQEWIAAQPVRPIELRASRVLCICILVGSLALASLLPAALIADDALSLDAIAYDTSVGEEVFLQFVTADDCIAGFLRLSLPRDDAWLPELRGSALLREVHVYGPSLPVGRRAAGRPQHRGLGRALVEAAARRAGEAGFQRLSVVSAVGTRAYYRELGFTDGALYQHLPLKGAGA